MLFQIEVSRGSKFREPCFAERPRHLRTYVASSCQHHALCRILCAWVASAFFSRFLPCSASRPRTGSSRLLCGSSGAESTREPELGETCLFCERVADYELPGAFGSRQPSWKTTACTWQHHLARSLNPTLPVLTGAMHSEHVSKLKQRP
jgi:hypothetical protein